MGDIIATKNLYKKYSEAPDFSVRDVSLNIAEKEIFGLLGPNGAGKTTLISMLCGLTKPTSGSFSIAGFSSQRDFYEIKKIIGIVPQEYALYPDLTAQENLRFFGSMYGLKGSALKNKITENLAQLGLLPFAHRKVRHFSGGMRRRCNLIASVLHAPKVLFLDEPTVGVDVQSKSVMLDFLKNLNSAGTTIVYTSHHLAEAEDFCTRISIMDYGNIFAADTPENLIRNTENAKNLEDVFLSLTGKALRDG